MARLDMDAMKKVDEFINGLFGIAGDIDNIAKDCIDEAIPTLENALKRNIKAAANRKRKKRKTGERIGKPYSTGELVRSIEPTKAKTNAYGNFAAVRPVGTDSNGVRNGEKLAYLEYGTSVQEARPVMQRAIEEAEPQTRAIIQKRFEEYAKKYLKQ